MMKLLSGLGARAGVLTRVLALFMVFAGLAPMTAVPLYAQPAVLPEATAPAATVATDPALLARQAELQSRIHGTRSARGMVVNDQAALTNIRLEPVRLANGEYMLRAVDTATGQFTRVSHPTLKAQLRDVMGKRFATPEAAATSAPSYKGHLTRTANTLEGTYRGRLGGLQTQLNSVNTQINQPVVETATGTSGRTATGTSEAGRPVVENSGAPRPVTETNGAGRPVVETATGTNSSGAGAPRPVTEATATNGAGTNAGAGNGSSTTGSGSNTVRGGNTSVAGNGTAPVVETATTGAVVSETPGAPRAPGSGSAGSSSTAAAGEGTSGARPNAASETTVPVEAAPAAPVTRMGQIRNAAKGALKDSVKMIPLMLATGLAVDLANQYRENGSLSLTQAVSNVMTTEFVMAMGGAVTGGTVGSIAGTLLSSFAGPLGPFVKAAATIGGAAFGANFASGAEIDWGRLAFTTALTAGATLLVPGGILGLAAVTATGFGADWLYDKLFGKKKEEPAPRASAPPNYTPIPVPHGGPNPNPPTANPPPTPTPTQIVQPPTPIPPTMQPPPAYKPPLPPDKNDPFADLPYAGK